MSSRACELAHRSCLPAQFACQESNPRSCHSARCLATKSSTICPRGKVLLSDGTELVFLPLPLIFGRIHWMAYRRSWKMSSGRGLKSIFSHRRKPVAGRAISFR